MRSAFGVIHCRVLILFFLGSFLLPLALAMAQEAQSEGPSAPAATGPSGQPTPEQGAPAAEPTPPPAAPAGEVSVPPGVPTGPADFPAPILPDFPSPTIPAGEPIGPIPPVQPLRFAPQPVGPSPLQLRTFITVEEEYTDNANQTKTDRQSQFQTSIAPGLSAHFEGSRSNLDFAYSPRGVIVTSGPSDSRVDQYLRLRGSVNVMPQIRLSLSEDFTDSSDFRDVGNVGTTRTGQTPFITNRATAEAAYMPPKGQVALAYTNVYNQEDVSNADNSDTHIVRASGDLANPRLGLGGSYTLTRGLYTISSDYWENTVEVHANRSVTPTVTANLSAQFTQHNADQPQAEDFSLASVRIGGVLSLGPSGSLSAQVGGGVFAPRGNTTTVRPSGALLWTQRFSYFALSVSYSSGFQENFQSVDNTGVSYVQSGSAYLSSVTFRDLTAVFGARWNREKFEQTTTSGGPAGTRDTTWDLEGRLEYSLARPLVLTLGYIYTIRSSTVPTNAFVENRVRLGLTYRYDIF